MVLAQIFQNLADIMLRGYRIARRQIPGTSHLGIDVLARDVVVEAGADQAVYAASFRIVRAFDMSCFVSGMIDDEVDIRMFDGGWANISGVCIFPIEAG